jgi:hypothetical protein
LRSRVHSVTNGLTDKWILNIFSLSDAQWSNVEAVASPPAKPPSGL